ncbi:MAG TPA: Rieske 2Fe-2S domain-containing protein [Candidatus Binatia bacterium]|nr:Rieske 2Fe-2S domain-containing protein [Candidatus Binatia bacterium]
MGLSPFETRASRQHRLAEVSRRQFILMMGALGALGATVLGAFEVVKFMFPLATNEQPQQFKTSFKVSALTPANPVVADYTHRVIVVMDDAGVYAILDICTHLGCTPNYATDVGVNLGPLSQSTDARALQHGERSANPSPSQVKAQANGFICPCHGSRYFIDSTNFYGPAPRPMDWVYITTTPDGYFFVDSSKLVAYRSPGQTTTVEWRMDPKTGQNNGKTVGV